MMENNNNSGLFTGGMGGMGTQSQLQVKWEGNQGKLANRDASDNEKKQGWGSETFFHGSVSGSAEKKNPDPTWNRNEEINIFIF